MEEETFPRGGLKKRSSVDEKTRKRGISEVQVTKPGESKLSESKKRKTEKKRNNKKEKKGNNKKDGQGTEKQTKHTIEGEVSGQISKLQPQFLSKKNLYPGMLLLGCVKQLKNYSIVMALPNGLSGTVPITNVSEAYTESLQKYSEAEETNVESVSTLSELFKTGMLLACKVTEFDFTADAKTLTLSINPKDVNGDLTTSSLRHGMCVYGSVVSHEDHGYVLDIGIHGVQAFLKNKHAERFITLHNEGCALRVGQCVLCKLNMKGDRMAVLAGQNRVIPVTIDPVELKGSEMSDSLEIAFSSLVPGMKLHARVERAVKDDGIVVQFHKFRGVIHKTHLPKLPSSYSHGQEVACRILYIHPLTKSVALTMLPNIVDYVGVPMNVFGDYKFGDIIEEATVKRMEKKRGVYLGLPNGVTAFAGMSNLSDEGEDRNQLSFKQGSTHRCRIIGFQQMEALVIVTLKKSVLDEKYMRASDVHPGDVIECKMKKLETKGMTVELLKKMTAFIPTIHLADVPLKHPEQKFKVDENLRCRVLYVNKKHSKITLTHKKSLINSKYPVISSYDQVKVGQILEGFIDGIKDFGCFVKFYNNVQGLVPRPLLSTEDIQYPEKVFYMGQVVRCKVLSVDPPNERLKLTFILEGTVEFGKKTKEVPADFKLGKCVGCKVMKKNKTGLDVELTSSGGKAFIPKMHLSDSLEICEALLTVYQPGDVIEQAMYWSCAKLPVLTCKPSLIEAGSREDEFVTSFDALQPGMLLSGAVRSIQPYGIFLEFTGKLFGLVPKPYAADRPLPDLGQFYCTGQTVQAKVLEIKKDKERFLASLRMQDCYHGNTQIGLDLTWIYLKEKQNIIEKMSQSQGVKGKLAALKLGSIYTVTVKKVTDLGAICELDGAIKAIVVKENIPGVVTEGDSVDAALLFIDIFQNCVEISLAPDLLKFIRTRQTDKKAKSVSVGQVVKASVQLIKEDMVIVCISTGHARGTLAYLPAKRHWNDVLERHQFTIGQENKVMVKRIDGDVILASLKVHEDTLEKEESLPSVPFHQLKVGDICTATVKSVFKDCLHINIGKTYGRVTVTEIMDEINNGTCPTEGYKKNQEIKVRVIGFRESKGSQYLPISHPNFKKALPECTMKPSLLSCQNLPKDYINSRGTFQLGDKVIAAIENIMGQYQMMCVYPGVQGKVHVFNLSHDVQKLNEAHVHFRQGQCYNATVISVINKQQLELSLLEHPVEVEPGKPTVGLVKYIGKNFGLHLQLPEWVHGIVDLTDIEDEYTDDPTKRFKVGEVISGTVITVEKLSKQAVVSLRKSVASGNKARDPRLLNEHALKEGSVLRGYITKASRKGITVSLGPNITGVVAPESILEGKLVVKMSKHFKKASVVTVKVLGFDKNNKLELSLIEKDTGVKLSLNTRFVLNAAVAKSQCSKLKRSLSESSADSGSGNAKKTKLKNIETNDLDESIQLDISDADDTKSASDSDDEVASSTSHSLEKDRDTDESKRDTDMISYDSETLDKDWESLKETTSDEDLDGKIVKDTKTEKNRKSKTANIKSESVSKDTRSVDKTPSQKRNDKGKKVSAIKSESESVETSKLEVAAGEDLEKQNSQKKVKGDKVNDQVNRGSSPKKTKLDAEDLKDISTNAVEVTYVSKSDVKVEKPVLEISEGFTWDSDFHLPPVRTADVSSGDSDDDDDTQKPVKKTREQLRQERMDEEKRLYKTEMQRLEGDVQPETADDFDRLVLQSPDSSLVWLRYMAFHLETTEIDKARAVAERALKTISFREEQEKLNVWVAYLNLENMYGTPESVRSVLARAVQQSEEIKVYYQMLNIYVNSNKIEEAEQLMNTLVKKYSADKAVWIKFAEFYFQNGRVESARKLLQRCLKSLETKSHVDTITKFAQFEFKYGEPERGKTMFENTLSTYPKRTDLWSVYIDMVTKLGELDTTRSLYNRVLSHKMSMKKMKFFFKKFLEFEEKYGTADQIADVKKKALQYVESQGFVDE